jgi:hypothetical protein
MVFLYLFTYKQKKSLQNRDFTERFLELYYSRKEYFPMKQLFISNFICYDSFILIPHIFYLIFS